MQSDKGHRAVTDLAAFCLHTLMDTDRRALLPFRQLSNAYTTTVIVQKLSRYDIAIIVALIFT